MYSVKFYRDSDGNEPVKEYLQQLRKKQDKDSRINHEVNFGINTIEKLQQ